MQHNLAIAEFEGRPLNQLILMKNYLRMFELTLNQMMSHVLHLMTANDT